MMFARFSIAGLAAAGLLLAVFGVSPASAQYPPPSGNCGVTVATASVAAGGSASITIVIRDANGNPVPGTPVSASISKQPGSGATVTLNSSTTDANGQVTGTVQAGSTAGIIEVTATAPGVTCSAQLAAGQGAVAPEIALPNTGTGPTDGASAPLVALVLLALAGFGVVTIGAVARRAARG